MGAALGIIITIAVVGGVMAGLYFGGVFDGLVPDVENSPPVACEEDAIMLEPTIQYLQSCRFQNPSICSTEWDNLLEVIGDAPADEGVEAVAYCNTITCPAWAKMVHCNCRECRTWCTASCELNQVAMCVADLDCESLAGEPGGAARIANLVRAKVEEHKRLVRSEAAVDRLYV